MNYESDYITILLEDDLTKAGIKYKEIEECKVCNTDNNR